jgi:hypothetical protein
VGIKTKKKKKFRKWQKNSGAIFEKEGVIMGWEEIVKDSRQRAIDSYETTKKELEDKLKDLTSHPQFDLEETIDKIDGSFYIYADDDYVADFAKMLLTGEITFESGAESPILNYVEKSHELEMEYWEDPNVDLLNTATWLLSRTKKLFFRIIDGISFFRSVKFLQEVAETFGVNLTTPLIDIVKTNSASFNHKGLRFLLHKGGVMISNPASDLRIEVCVVDEKRLPIGDFFASMLGLIVARPEELDVVNFGIQLGLIMASYSGYDWYRATDDNIAILTPFNAGNNENIVFADMLTGIETDDHDLAPDVLLEIEGALEDCFGSTRGFF